MCVVCAYHGRYDRDVYHVRDVLDHLGRGRGVDDHACDALHLGYGCELYRALTCRRAAAHAYEHRALGCGEQGLRDGGLCREGIDRKDGV